jgi:TonB-linked SusC/RagA family outer membrane protein
VRRDGSSKFGENNRYGVFPSFAGGIKISELPFFPKNDVINFFKARVGWGQLGNQEIGDYVPYVNVSYGMNYTYGPYGDQNTYPGGAPRGYANQDVKWEATNQLNIGLDANLLKFKLSVNFDYFNRLTKDMLAQVPVPGISGIQVAPFVNIGEVSNKGFELNVSYREKTGDLIYKIGFNFTHVKNEVISLGDGLPISSAPYRAMGNLSRTEVGYPIAYFYGYETDGYYQNQAEIDTLNARAVRLSGRSGTTYDGRNIKPGDIKMKDQNGDYQINEEDLTNIGSPHPKFTYGLNLELDYKGFDLKIFGQGVYGNKVVMATKYYLESGDAYWNVLTTMNDYWQKEGDQTSVPKLGLSADNMRFSDRYVESGSYFRIKTLQLGYTLPASLTSKIGIERMRIFGNLQNYFSFHNYKGFDPEIGYGRSSLDIGIDRGMYPLAKSATIGVNVTL